MMRFGYTLSSEEHAPADLVRNARRAEELGFDFVSISDHFHPWISEQGHSPFVWSTIGGIAAVTETIEVGVGVACPLIRIHPAIVAHAAATCAVMLEGRFFLGVGTGELLNEHVVARRWPAIEIRREMLREAIEIIRQLCSGEVVDFHGRHYEVENARLFTHPAEVPPIVVSAFGPAAIEMAVELGDGVWSTSPDRDLLRQYADAGGSGPRIGQVTLCWSDDRDEAVRIAHRVWPTAGMPGQLSQELPTTTSFEQVAQLVSTDDVAQRIPCGPDVDPVREVIETYARAGFDHLHLHQIGPDQDGFFRFWEKELQPLLEHAR